MFEALNGTEDKEPPGLPLEKPVSVGQYAFVQEKARKSSKIFSYVVKVVEDLGDHRFTCEWYELNLPKLTFSQKNAKWPVKEDSLLYGVDPPTVYGEGRRARIIFPKVYKFLTGKEFSE